MRNRIAVDTRARCRTRSAWRQRHRAATHRYRARERCGGAGMVL